MSTAIELELWRRNLLGPEGLTDQVSVAIANMNSQLAKCSERLTEETHRLRNVTEAEEVRSKDAGTAYEGMVNAHRKRFEGIEAEFKVRMALEAPVKLWDTRRMEHLASAKCWGWASVIIAVLSVLALFMMAKQVFPDVSDLVSKYSADPKTAGNAGAIGTSLLVAEAAKFAVVSIIVLWLLRILVRNYVSQTHLAADAAERAAVMQTFLSMSSDAQLRDLPVVREKGLPLALERAFSKAQDGIVRDDAMPTSSLFSLFGKNSG